MIRHKLFLFDVRFAMLRILSLLVLAFCTFYAVQALAQVPADSQLAAQQTTLISFDPNGLLGSVFKVLETVLLAIAALAAKRFDTFLAGRAASNKAAAVGYSLWTKIQAITHHCEVELKPLFDKDMEDGKLTSDEAKALKNAALALVRRDCADEIAQLPKLFGLGNDSAIGVFLSGLLEQAVNLVGGSSPGLAKALGGDTSAAPTPPAAPMPAATPVPA